MRLLWKYVARARKDYDCIECDFPIFKGDWYVREVYALSDGLWITRKHDRCPEDPDPDYFYEEFDHDEEYLLAA